MPDHGSWSWFDLMLATPTNSPPRVADNGDTVRRSHNHKDVTPDLREKLSCRSHTHPVNSTSSLQTHTSGDQFAPGSESMDRLWKEAEVGDVLIVRACAQFPGWRNEVESVNVKAWVSYEPML